MQSTSAPQLTTDTSPRTPLRLAPRPKPPVSVFAPDPEQVITWRRLAADVADSAELDGAA